MSTALDIPPPRELEAPATPQPRGKNAYAFVDQILISGTNFITGVLTARALGRTDYGIFTVVYSILLFANSLQSALIVQPHNVLGWSRTKDKYVPYTSATGLFQIIIAVVLTLLTLLCVAIGSLGHHLIPATGHFYRIFNTLNNTRPLLLALAVSIFAWQMQEFVRRVLYTERRFGQALLNDVISYGGQALAIAALWYVGKLNGPTALYALAATSLLALFLGYFQLRQSISWTIDKNAFGENWRFGKWLVGAEVLGWFSSLQTYLYLAAAIINTQATASLRAAQIILGPTRVVAFYLCNVLPMRYSRTLKEGGNKALARQMRATAALFAPLMGAYCLLIGVTARFVLRKLMGEEYAGGATVLSLFSISAFVSYMAMILTAALTARGDTRPIFVGTLWSVVITVLFGWFFVWTMGVNGAMVGLIVATLVMTWPCWTAYRHPSQGLTHNAQSEPSMSDQPKSPTASADPHFVNGVFRTLNEARLPFCVLHGYENLDQGATSDVDCMMPKSVLPQKLAHSLHANREKLNADVVNWLDDGAHYVVLAGFNGAPRPHVLPLHVTSNYEAGRRIFYSGDEILSSRQQHGDFFIPQPALEFGCTLVNRIHKSKITQKHQLRLSQLFQQDPAGATAAIEKFWQGENAHALVKAASTNDWSTILETLPQLRDQLRSKSARSQRAAIFGRTLSQSARRIKRWLFPPCGLHVVFLGPDGVGKSTVIERVTQDLGPAFLGVDYHTFAPSMIPNSKPKKSPHALPPRGLLASYLKAAWWSLCYTIGYYAAIHPGLARSSLVINHRYLLDATVDPKRYRYSGPIWLLKLIWLVVPKPHLIILLDAPAQVIQERKSEVAPEECARQCQAYRDVMKNVRNGHVINAARPLDEVVGEVDRLILATVSKRTARRLNLGGAA